MFTMRIPGTGWRGANNGASWDDVDLTNKFVEEATVRFQGVTTVTEGDWTTTAQQIYSKSGTASGGTTTRSESVSVSPPSGYGFHPAQGDRFVVQSTLTGNDGVTGGIGNPAEVRAQGQQKTTNSLLDGRTLEQRTPLTQIPSTATHYFNRQAGHGYHFLWRAFVRFSKQEDPTYNHTQNPSVSIDGGGSYTYIGTLEQGQASPLVTGNLTTELVNDQVNELNFSSGGSNRAFAWLSVKYSTRPKTITQPPENVGPESVRMAGFLETDGHKETTCGFEIRKAGVQQWNSHEAGVTESGSMYYVTLSGLDTIQEYEYRAWAENANGKVYGSIQLFETDSYPPVVSTLDVEGISYFEGKLNGELLSTGGLETTVHFEWGPTDAMGNYSGVVDTFDPLNTGQFTWDLTGLDYDTLYYYQAYAVNAHGGESVGTGEKKTFRTAYPHIAPPINLVPMHGTRVEDVQPTFNFEFVEKTENPATKYHARIRFSLNSSMMPTITEMHTKDNLTGWEAYINDEWVAFPSVGVDPGTPIRVTVQNELPFGPIYWDCAAWDGDRYGFDAKNRVDIYIPFEGIYGIYIGHPDFPTVQEEWTVLDQLDVIEASNGEIGSIDFNVHNILVTPLNLLTANESAVTGTVSDYEEEFGSLSIIDTDSYKGVQCLELTAAPNSTFTLYRAAFRLHYGSPVVGEVYTISGYFKKTNPDDIIRVRVFLSHQQDDGGGSYINVKTDIGAAWSEPDGNGWSRIWFTSSPIEDDVDRIELRYYFSNRDGFSPVYVDALQFEKNDLPSTWELGRGAGMTPYPAAQQIPYGAPVLLACRDQYGQVEEFQGWVRDKNPHGEIMQISAILTDGILAERIITKNYPAETPDTINITGAVTFEENPATEATITGHSLTPGDMILISETADYDGIYNVLFVDGDTLYIDAEFGEAEAGDAQTLLDVGETIAQIVDEYCAPINSSEVNATTGFVAAIQARGKTALQVIEDIRRQYGFHYFVDRLNNMHFYRPDEEITIDPSITVRRGD